METSIETINGKLCTVIHSDEPKPLGRNIFTKAYPSPFGYNIYGNYMIEVEGRWENPLLATALFALPRNPTPEDAPLLYRYASEGIRIIATVGLGKKSLPDAFIASLIHLHDGREHYTITHAVDNHGNRVEVAIHD